METRLVNDSASEIMNYDQISNENRLEILDEFIRKKYLARLSELPIAPISNLPELEEDLISNVRLYKITEMVYQKGEPVTDKFTTVFNTLSTYNASAFVLIDSDGKETNFYLGVRNNEPNGSPLKRSTVTLGDTLKQTLIGHFPGVKIENEDRKKIADLSNKISKTQNVASVSVVGNSKSNRDVSNEQFVQGLEKLALAMNGRPYTGLIIANNQNPQEIQNIRRTYQNLYTMLSPLQKKQISDNTSTSTSRNKSFFELDGKQKAAMLANAVIPLAGTAAIAVAGANPLGVIIGGPVLIKSIRESRTEVIKAIMEPWMPGEIIEFSELARALNSLEVSRSNRKLLSVMICTYRDHNGHMLWDEKSLIILRQLLFDILNVSSKVFGDVVKTGDPDALRRLVISKTIGFTLEEIDEVCHILTMEE